MVVVAATNVHLCQLPAREIGLHQPLGIEGVVGTAYIHNCSRMDF